MARAERQNSIIKARASEELIARAAETARARGLTLSALVRASLARTIEERPA